MRFEKVACDRCGSEIDMTIPHKRDIWLSGKGREGGLDLCDECYEELFKWFTEIANHKHEIDKMSENDVCP